VKDLATGMGCPAGEGLGYGRGLSSRWRTWRCVGTTLIEMFGFKSHESVKELQ